MVQDGICKIYIYCVVVLVSGHQGKLEIWDEYELKLDSLAFLSTKTAPESLLTMSG